MRAIHYRPGRGRPGRGDVTACGRSTLDTSWDRTRDNVTCKRCLATVSFMRVATPVTPSGDVAIVQQVADYIAKRAHEVAEENGYCDTYAELTDEIGVDVERKFGVAWPQPERTWSLRFEEYEVRATSEEEAMKIVSNDLARYVSAYVS